MKKAVLTYIIGGYDKLKDPLVVTPGWDYFCVSDSGEGSKVWQPVPLRQKPCGLTCPKRIASFVKVMHHNFIAEDYDLCLTIDGSMQINCNLDRFLAEVWAEDTDLAIARHPVRDCLFDEAETVIDFGLDDAETVGAHTRRYTAEGVPRHYGLYGTRLMVKNNRSARLRSMCELWARELATGSRRDQLSLTYALWRQESAPGGPVRVNPFDFEDVYRRRKLFEITPHLGRQGVAHDTPRAPRRRRIRTFYDRIPIPKCLALWFLKMGNLRLCRSQEPYLASRFRPIVGYQPNLALPTKYHEKMMWRKLFDHNPLFVTFCDKLATKAYQAAQLPDLAIPETLWVGTDVRTIPKDVLRERIVIKASHGCGCFFYWEPGRSDRREVEALGARWMNLVHGQGDFEWGYSRVEPKLLAERRVGTDGCIDIGVRCAYGRPVLAHIILQNKTHQKQIGYFSPGGEPVPIPDHNDGPGRWTESPLPADFVLPRTFSDAVEAARVLSRSIDYARYDFLSDGDVLYAGEITVYPAAGLGKASPEGVVDTDIMVNDAWDLRKSWFLRTPQCGRRGLYAWILRCALPPAA